MQQIQSAEVLEIRFTSRPAIITSTIIVDGETIAQATFRDQLRLSTWTSTLEDIAKATRNSQKTAGVLKPYQGDTAHALYDQVTAASRPKQHQTLQYRDDQSSRDTDSPASSTPASSDGAETTSLAAGQSPGILLLATPR